MKAKGKYILIVWCLMLAACTGCSKKSSGSDDSVKPVISLTEPVNNAVYSAGDAISIKGTVTDDQFIAEIHIHISNNDTGELLMDIHRYPADQVAVLNEFIVASSSTNYKIQVIARDRGVNEAISTVFVSGN